MNIVSKKIGLIELVVESDMNDEVATIINFFTTFVAIRKIEFDQNLMGVEVTTSDGDKYNFECKFIRDENECKHVANLLNSKSNQISKDELLELLNHLEGEAVCIKSSNKERDDDSFTIPITFESFVGCKNDQQYTFGVFSDDNFNYSIDFDVIKTICYTSPVIFPNFNSCEIEIDFIDGSCLSIEKVNKPA